MLFRLTFSLFILYFGLLKPATSVAATEPSFDHALRQIGQSDSMVGLAVAVVRRGEVSSLSTFGVREFGRPEQIDAQTTFRIASLSKGFAATIASKLVDGGELSFNDPISKFNKDFQLSESAQAKSATLADVLSHRLSLPPYAYDNLLEAGISPPTILREMKKVTPVCRVGSCYAYQNVGFNMVTSAIESVSKQSYESIVANQLFTPLGMRGASFGMNALRRNSNWARSHRRVRNSPTPTPSWKVREVKQAYYDVPAAGGINASISDMAKWLAAQMGYAPNMISIRHLKALHTPLVATSSELRRNRRLTRLTEAHYGLGWRIYKYAGETVVNHSGSVEGYTAQIAFLPTQDVGIVLLSNSRSREFWDILPLFLDHELGLENDRLLQMEARH